MESTGREQAVVWEARRDDPEAPGAQRCRTARRPEREDRGAGTRGSPDKQTEQRTQTREAKVSASEGEARGPERTRKWKGNDYHRNDSGRVSPTEGRKSPDRSPRTPRTARGDKRIVTGHVAATSWSTGTTGSFCKLPFFPREKVTYTGLK